MSGSQMPWLMQDFDLITVGDNTHIEQNAVVVGHDIRKGIIFNVGAGCVCVSADVSSLLADERGHKFAQAVKGSRGFKICALCCLIQRIFIIGK